MGHTPGSTPKQESFAQTIFEAFKAYCCFPPPPDKSGSNGMLTKQHLGAMAAAGYCTCFYLCLTILRCPVPQCYVEGQGIGNGCSSPQGFHLAKPMENWVVGKWKSSFTASDLHQLVCYPIPEHKLSLWPKLWKSWLSMNNTVLSYISLER